MKQLLNLIILFTIPKLFLIQCKSREIFWEEYKRPADHKVYYQKFYFDSWGEYFDTDNTKTVLLTFKGVGQEFMVEETEILITSYKKDLVEKSQRHFSELPLKKFYMSLRIRTGKGSYQTEPPILLIEFNKLKKLKRESDSIEGLFKGKNLPDFENLNISEKLQLVNISSGGLWKSAEIIKTGKLQIRWTNLQEDNGLVPYSYTEYQYGKRNPLFFKIKDKSKFIYKKLENEFLEGNKVFQDSENYLYYYLSLEEMQVDIRRINSLPAKEKSLEISLNQYPFLHIKRCEPLCKEK